MKTLKSRFTSLWLCLACQHGISCCLMKYNSSVISSLWLASHRRRAKSPLGTVLIINLLGKGLTPRACMGDGGSIWWAPAFTNSFASLVVSRVVGWGVQNKATPERSVHIRTYRACAAKIWKKNLFLISWKNIFILSNRDEWYIFALYWCVWISIFPWPFIIP